MAQLYVEVYRLTGDEADVPVQSAVCLFLISYLQNPKGVSLSLVQTSTPTKPSLQVDVSSLQFRSVERCALRPPVSDCCLPVFAADNSSCVAGLCAVLRQVIKHSGEEWRHLLGFREGCLFACAEVSPWTKFCEIDVVEVVHEVLMCTEARIPIHLARFEEHLKQPVRMHNIDKLRKETNQDNVGHHFAEGPTMSLADLIIVPCVFVFVKRIGIDLLEHSLPSTVCWYELVAGQRCVSEALVIIRGVAPMMSRAKHVVPDVPKQSLYKSDSKRYKPKSKIFTRQEDVEAALLLVDEMQLELAYESEPFGHEVSLNWHQVPDGVVPDVPPIRLARKKHQLENLAKAIVKIAKPRDTIVDFCCGSGHLGILVAYSLPRCRVVLLDNKEESLVRAKERVKQLGLDNVTVVQCNLDYFIGPFQVGASLHACGVASDLVIHSCLQRRAAFVVCPCCYGSLQANHVVSYPRSAVMSDLPLPLYLVLGHCADQTHKRLYAKSEQGERCMAAVDSDRCHFARERGYSTMLAKLVPTTCSPKNNLIIGIPHSQQHSTL